VLCELHSKDKKDKRHSQDNEDKEVVVQRTKKSRRGHGCLSVVSVVCLSGRGLCDGLITRPEESYRLCCVIHCV
jgi:hypothetical protein